MSPTWRHPNRLSSIAKGMLKLRSVLFALSIPLLILVTYAVYKPGLQSPFLLDDNATLGGITQVGDLGNTEGILRYLFSNGTGYLTRPFSKLSFLVDATTWPVGPKSFKRTNILLHILNGLLVISLILRLARHLGWRNEICVAVALITGALWLLHPLNVSTTLYVVQRMTMLATFFMLLGIIVYMLGRQIMAEKPGIGYTLVSVGVGGGTILAFLCKEIGILLPIYILVIETCLLRTAPRPTGWMAWKSVFLYLPALFVLGWQLLVHLPNDPYASRPFDLSERLLTETRVVMDYLRLILLPTRAGTGVFQDDFPLSHSLLDPPTTLMAVLAIACLLGSAIHFRTRLPVYSLAVFWFFAGHVLESGAIALEIYFEHRNYLPMLGPLFAVVYYATIAATRIRPLVRVGLAAYVSLAVFATWHNVKVWGDPLVNAVTWEEEHPESVRANQYAMNFWLRLKQYEKANAHLQRIMTLEPSWTGPRIERVLVSCLRENPPSKEAVDGLISELSQTEWDAATDQILDNLYDRLGKSPCGPVDYAVLLKVTETLIDNPSFRRKKPTLAGLYILKSRIHEQLGQHEQQALALNNAYHWNKNWHIAIQESIVWKSLAEYQKALDAVARARQLYTLNFKSLKFAYDSDELEAWEIHLTSLQSATEPESNDQIIR